MKREAHPRGRVTRPAPGCLAIAVIALGAILAPGVGAVQAPAPSASRPGAPAPTRSVVREEGVRWQSLTQAQRDALTPLERDWSGIDAQRKQKWLALAARFKTLPPDERARISARMSEWAKLTPAERGQARMRFEEARQVPATDRSARWQAYQALPAERKQALAARAASAASPHRDGSSRAGRAGGSKEAKVNVVPNPALTQGSRQIAPTLVQAGPGATTTSISRKPSPPAHQPAGMPKIATTPEFVNRSTLLPRRGPQAAAVTPASGVAAPAPVPLPVRPIAASAPR